MSQARTVEELAKAIEPLAKALATLSSEASQTLAEIEQKTKAASIDFQRQIAAANDSLAMVVQATTQSTRQLKQATNQLSLIHFVLVMGAGLLSALLVIGSWHWYRPPTAPSPIDPKAVAENLKPVVIEALKNAKEAKPAKGK